MKRIIFVLGILGSLIIFFGCQEESFAPEISQNDPITNSFAKQVPKLTGTTYCDFTLTPPTFWNGTITIEGKGVYGLTFISHDEAEPKNYSQAEHFVEDLIIYQLGTDWTNPENVYMVGQNAGVVTYANKLPEPVNFLSNGKIVEAYGPFEQYMGFNWHIKGVVTWATDGLPAAAIGTFQIN